jgi:hypothetical protein
MWTFCINLKKYIALHRAILLIDWWFNLKADTYRGVYYKWNKANKAGAENKNAVQWVSDSNYHDTTFL